MSFRLRPKGGPCLRSLRGTLMVVAGAVALATAPAATANEYLKPLGWYTEDAGVPATVKFEDVAANDDGTVIAVGSDSATGKAVIYRRVAETWQQDAYAAMPDNSKLVDVDVSGGTYSWAVGSWTDPAQAVHPLVLELSDPVSGTPVWSDHSDRVPAGSAPTAVALVPGGATIGDSQGNLYRETLAGPSATPAASAGAINGIELFDADSGLAVAGFNNPVPKPDDNTVRIYELNPAPVLEPATAQVGAQVNMTSLAATETYQAAAVDSTGNTWRIKNDAGDWVQETAAGLPEGRQLAAVGSVPGGEPAKVADAEGWATEFLAGAIGTGGAMWQRTRWGYREQAWAQQGVPAGTPPLTAVAAAKWDAAWAVGEGGTIIRYWRPPDPEAQAAAEQAAADQAAADQAAADQAAAEQAAAEQAAADQAAAEQAAADQAAADQQQDPAPSEEPTAQPSAPPPAPVEVDRFDMNGIVIDDSPTRGTERPRKPLLSNVKVLRKGQKLIISFRLRAKARVRLIAKRGSRVVGKTRMRTLGRGRRKLVLRFRGDPPSSLKVVVRRVSGARGNR